MDNVGCMNQNNQLHIDRNISISSTILDYFSSWKESVHAEAISTQAYVMHRTLLTLSPCKTFTEITFFFLTVFFLLTAAVQSLRLQDSKTDDYCSLLHQVHPYVD